MIFANRILVGLDLEGDRDVDGVAAPRLDRREQDTEASQRSAGDEHPVAATDKPPHSGTVAISEQSLADWTEHCCARNVGEVRDLSDPESAAFSAGKNLQVSAGHGACVGEHRVQLGIVVIWVVVERDKPSHFGHARQLDRVADP